MSALGKSPWVSSSFLLSCRLNTFGASTLSLRLHSTRLPSVHDGAWFPVSTVQPNIGNMQA